LIIPAINCADFQSANKHIRLAERFLSPSTGWIQIDVSDGQFGCGKSWGDPEEFASLSVHLNTEIHLMTVNPELSMIPWLKIGVRRLIVPVQVVGNMEALVKEARKFKAEVVPSFDLSVSMVEVEKYLEDFDCMQILAVEPGRGGQEFNPEALTRINFLRGKSRGVKIEVDGGINPETAIQSLQAGADVLVSGSYIFERPDPSLSYKELESLL
jgi:ribulose-phosphate 3-epimerase